MPLIEFECAGCARRFEDLVRRDERPACPACGGRDLRRLLSGFGVGSAPDRSESSGGCGSCGDPRGPGSCSR